MVQDLWRKRVSRIETTLEITGRLFKTYIKDMPTLFYFWTRRGVFCWSRNEGWNITHWQTFRELRQYFERDQGGSIYPSSELEFLMETGKSVVETFDRVCLTNILNDYNDLVDKYNKLVVEKKNE
jgi:hypothetical protein